jgi:WD40 repeat protein/serine/threonine protein kinase/DNA-binding XRE family transcriptional regulator
MNQQIDFGQHIKDQRGWKGLTQAELARRVACATITIRKIEANDLRPSVQIADRIAMALDVPAEERTEFVRSARSISPDTPDRLPTPTPTPTSKEVGRADLSGRAIRGYELADRIGTGGFGVVYRANQPIVEREVAVKIILPKYANDPNFIRRFEAEAKLVARLEHPYIVPLYDYWREPGAAYLIMRLLRGGNLRQRIVNNGGPLPIDFIMGVLSQIGAALHTAHRAGVIHRDLKPANILLDEDEYAYLSDFGIAKQFGSPELAEATGGEFVSGSPAYASPEQFTSDPISPQADIYSLGILLYEMLCGAHPFECESPWDYYLKHTREQLPSLSSCNPGLASKLDPVLGKATAKDPLDRYPDVPGLVTAFQDTLAMIPAVEAQFPIATIIPPESIENPYKGLRPFREADQDDYFGQETLIQTLLGRMSEEENDLFHFLAVVGPSGSGKSSVVRAGLVPALRRGGLPGSENWFIVEMHPGAHPLQELEAALLKVAVKPPQNLLEKLQDSPRGLMRCARHILPEDPDVELVLVIDQFEEIFTLVTDDALRIHFLESLVAAVVDPDSRLRIVTTMRTDFLDQSLQHIDFGELVRQQSEMVLPLSPDELELAIVAPARRAGLVFEPGFVARIIREIGDQPGGLPLLQYSLTELFERREGVKLTISAYEEFSGVLGALGNRAEEIYTGLDSAGKDATRQIFLRLVTLGEGTEDTRRRVERVELDNLLGVDQRDVERVVEQYGRHRLLTFDRHPNTRRATVEVAHEAVLREWRRLRRWLDESRVDLHMQRVLTNFTMEWEESGRDPGLLLRGTRLSQYEEWVELSTVRLTDQESELLAVSLAARQERELQEAERQTRETVLERRSRNFLRGLVGVFAVAAVIAVVLSIFAFNTQRTAVAEANQRATAQAQAEVAQAEALDEANQRSTAQAEAESEAFARATAQAVAEAAEENAQAQRKIAEDEARAAKEAYSLSLAANARQYLKNNESASALALAMAANGIQNPPVDAQNALMEAAYAPGARSRYVVEEVFEGVQGPAWSVAISPDGRTALIGLEDGTIIHWDLESEQEIQRFHGHSGTVRTLAFSPDGLTTLSGGDDELVVLWDLSSGQAIRQFVGHDGVIRAVKFIPDDRTIISAGEHNCEFFSENLIIWDVDTGLKINSFPGGHQSLDISPDGRYLISKDDCGGVLGLLDLETEQVVHDFGSSFNEFDLDISPDGNTMLVASSDYYLYHWDLATKEQIQKFDGHNNILREVEFLPDGNRAISGDTKGALIMWDLTNNSQVATFQVHTSQITDLSINPNGKTALTSSLDGTLIIWDLNGAGEIQRFEDHKSKVLSAAFTPDGKYLLSSGGWNIGDPEEDYAVRVWDVESGELLHTYNRHDGMTFVVPGSDSQTAFSYSLDGTISYWDIESGEEIHRFLGHENSVVGLSLHPDGHTLVSSSWDSTLRTWDLESGEQIDKMEVTDQSLLYLLDISPDGSTILSAAEGGILLRDMETLEPIHAMQGSEGNMDVQFSSDGRLALSTSRERGVVLWEVETGQELHRFGPGNTLVAFSPDGLTVLFGPGDGSVEWWDLETLELLRRFTGHQSLAVWDVDFSPDGRTAISGAEDGVIIHWQLAAPPLDELLEWIADNRYVREFTQEEREQYRLETLFGSDSQ